MSLSLHRIVRVTFLLAITSVAEAGQLSLRFTGGGDEVTLGHNQTAEIEVVWTMHVLDTAKSGAKLTGLNLRFNVDEADGSPASGLTVEDVSVLSGWQNSSSDDVPFTESDFFLGTADATGAGIAGNGTVFETVIATFTIRNNEPLAEPDALVTMRHSSPGDLLPAAEIDAGYWSLMWQQDVVASKQFGLGAGNAGDADAVWDPYHGYETFEPLTIHLAGGSQIEPPPPCQQKTWTTTAEFAEVVGANNWVKGVNLDRLNTPDALKVVLDQTALQPLPYLWAACSGRGTIVRIDTESLQVVGEYLSAPGPYDDDTSTGRARNPSRTTVDLFGNVWAGNRDVDADGKGGVVKIGLVIGGTRVNANGSANPQGEYLKPPFQYCTCEDRTGPGNVPDGLIRTSRGLDHILAWPDDGDGNGGGCGPALVDDAQDECITIYQRVNPPRVRHVSVDVDNNVWVGADRRGPDPADTSRRYFDLLAGETGEILQSIEGIYNQAQITGGYGGLVDGQGVLWSATQGSEIGVLRYDTKKTLTSFDDTLQIIAPTAQPPYQADYGLGIDSGGSVWVGHWLAPPTGRITKLNPNGTLATGFPKYYTGGRWDRGLTVTPKDNHVWIANSGAAVNPGFFQTVTRLDNNGIRIITLDMSLEFPPNFNKGNGPTGLSVDGAGRVWVTCYHSHTAIRITPPPIGVDPTVQDNYDFQKVELDSAASVFLPYPYNYSDMTGIVGLMALKYGMWTTVHDSGVTGARWSRVSWNTQGACAQDPDTTIRVQMRAADSPSFGQIAVTGEPFVDVENGVSLLHSLVGRYVQVRAVLNGDSVPPTYGSPTLCDLTISGDAQDGEDCNGSGTADSCEFDDCNLNCIADQDDIDAGTSEDANGDGVPDECARGVIYVDAGAPGPAHHGTSWATAFTNVQDALAAAALTAGGDQIWVAGGTYLPTFQNDPPRSRMATFRLRCGVGLYGGFGGTEDPAWFDLAQRDLVAKETILSGDLAGNDGATFSNYGENVFHVVTGSDTDATTVLDGFTITGGNADGIPGHTDGAGMLIARGSPTIRNCIFRRNQADISSGKGGGVAIQLGGNASLVNCLFTGNQARFGGGIDVRHAEASVTNCTFSSNNAIFKGGAVEVSYQPGVEHQSSMASIWNCVLWGNTAAPGSNGPQIANSYYNSPGDTPNSAITVRFCDVEGGQAAVDRSGGGTLDWGIPPSNGNIVTNPAFAASGDFHLSPGSPCRDAGNNSVVPAEVLTDLDGNARIADGDGDGTAVVDMGAYEVCRADFPFVFVDWEPDCDVDLADFSAFMICLGGGMPFSSACLTAFDGAYPCGVLDFHDFEVFASQMSGPGEGCGQGMMGGEGGGESMSALGGDAPLDVEQPSGGLSDQPELGPPAAPAWTTVVLPVAIEIRALRGSVPLTVLVPDTDYAVHYVGSTKPIQGYLLGVSGDCGSECIASASPATSGAWLETGLFEYQALDDGALVLDDLPASEADSGPTGFLCTITMASAGELTFDLRTGWSDSAGNIAYELTGRVTVLVSAP